MRKALIALAVLAAPVAAQDKPAPTPGEIVAAAPKADWVTIAASDLLVMDLAPPDQGPEQASAKGQPRRVVIQLMPPPFSQGWIGNIRKLAAAKWWDGTSINRVQDNYVVQWGDAEAEDKARAKKLPAGLAAVPESEYQSRNARMFPVRIKQAKDAPRDSYAVAAIPLLGWPLGFDKRAAWPVHCYGMVGVGRDKPPDTGSGAELYTVIGHAPRHLDRNIALVGRVIEGIEYLSSLPRGKGDLGFYDLAQGDERVPVLSIRIGTEIADLAPYEYFSTESASFGAYAEARANRRDPFFIRPAGGADICNIPVPVRRAK
jgi:peptidylprolyl isomerase